MLCPTCQTLLPDGSRFCNKCGVATGKIDLKTTIRNAPETDPNDRIRDPRPDDDPRIGLVLDSKYQLLQRLGYQAAALHCRGYTLPEESVRRFRKRFGYLEP